MCPSAPRVCSKPGGQKPVLSLSLDLIGPLGTNFNEILIKIHHFLSRKFIGKWRPFYLGLNVLRMHVYWTSVLSFSVFHQRIDGLVQDCSIFSALGMEILQSCTKPSKYSSSPVNPVGTEARIYQNVVNIVTADALAPCVARSLATMISRLYRMNRFSYLMRKNFNYLHHLSIQK